MGRQPVFAPPDREMRRACGDNGGRGWGFHSSFWVEGTRLLQATVAEYTLNQSSTRFAGRLKMEENIKLPGSSFEEVVKIIQAYSQSNKAVPLNTISTRTGIHSTSVSRNTGFLVSVGIIEGGKNKQITPIGKRLGDAISLNLETEIRTLLRETIETNEFLKNLVGALRIRKEWKKGLSRLILPIRQVSQNLQLL